MSINNNNIADFISFLFRKRKGTEPPQELLDRWKALSNDEIGIQLSGLFQSWGLTDEDKRMEINTYFKETLFTPKPATQQQPPRVVPVPVESTQTPFNPFPAKQKRKRSKQKAFPTEELGIRLTLQEPNRTKREV